MRRRSRQLLIGLLSGGGVVNLLDAFFEALGDDVLLRYRLEETEGSAFINTGSVGAACNAALTAGEVVLGVDSGTPGAGLGIEADGSTTTITFPNNAAIQNVPAFTLLVVTRPDSGGEGNVGELFVKQNDWNFRTLSSQRLELTVRFDGGNANCVTAVNQYVYGNVYAFAARIGADRVPHIFVNAEETDYASQTTGTGTRSGQALQGGFAGVGATMDGGIFDVALVEGALSDEQILAHYEAAFLI